MSFRDSKEGSPGMGARSDGDQNSSPTLNSLAESVRALTDHFVRDKPRQPWGQIALAVSALGTLAAAVFAGWAAYETQKTAREAEKSNRAKVYLELYNEYQKPEMLQAMKALREWQQQEPEEFALEFQRLVNNRTLTPQEENIVRRLDQQRRRISHFFWKLKRLNEVGLLDENFISSVWGGGTYSYISEVLLPMERAKVNALYEIGAIDLAAKRTAYNGLEDFRAYYRKVLQGQGSGTGNDAYEARSVQHGALPLRRYRGRAPWR